MSQASYADQTDLFDPAKFSWPVHVIGCGGIGSALLLPLVKLGLRTELHLWDDDRVEPHNLPAQLLYRPKDLGRLKVEAAAEILRDYCEPSLGIFTHDYQVDENVDELKGVVISGVDSMKSRSAIWKALCLNPEVPLYMDGRIGGELTQLFTVDPCDTCDDGSVEFYEKWLFPDSEGSNLPCAARTVIGPPVLLAGRIITQFTRFARGLPTQRMIDDHVLASQTIAV